jgi:DNA-binding CsgD family transcriptional regulator
MDGHARALDRLAQVSRQGNDLVTFWRECSEIIDRVVPSALGPCWFTLDPASLLMTSHHQDGPFDIPPEWLAAEYLTDDFNKMSEVARSPTGVATLDEATGGEPERSLRYREEMAPNGIDQELLAAIRTFDGDAWGCVGLYRERGRSRFGSADRQFLRAASASLAEGARRALLIGEALSPDVADPAGLVVLDAAFEVESASPGAEAWLIDFPDGDRGVLPAAVLAVAARSRDGSDDANVRVKCRSGRWATVQGMVATVAGERRHVVTIELAHPARIAPLLMSAHGLTRREQDVTRLVLQGLSTAEIGAQLFISELTVQQHLKAVFAKCGVQSRRQLTAQVFGWYYEPRVHDNEHRATVGEPLRGGPLPPG